MRFNGLDLNLIVALDVILDERSVSAAAKRLNLSQPAISATLARLRAFFGDELMVQSGRRMIPTAYADSLRPLALRMLREAELLIATSTGFDPATSQRRFRLSTSDYILTVLVTPMLRRMEAIAPNVCIDVVPTGPEMLDELERGAIDCIISPDEFVLQNHPSELLFEESHVAVGWSKNPAMQRPLDLDEFLRLGHVAPIIGPSRSLAFAERHMQQYKDRRRIEVSVPSFSAIPAMLPQTQRIAVLQKRLALAFVDIFPITLRPLPFEIPPLREVVQFHTTRGNDAGVQWLIGQIKNHCRTPDTPLG